MQLTAMETQGENEKNVENILNAENKEQKVKVHFCKDNVHIYPSAKEGIPGTLYILEKLNKECFLAWTPNYMLQDHQGKSTQPEQSDLYALQVPLKEVRSIKKYTPSLKIPHIIIVSESGVAFPPYYFNNGGVREFFYALKGYVNLIKCDDDPNTFYLTDLDEPMSLLRSSMEKPPIEKEKIVKEPVVPAPNELQLANKPQSSTVENLSWTLLENFSKVTQFARSAAKGNILKELDSQLANQISSIENKVSPKIPMKPIHNASKYSNAAHSTTLGAFELVESESNIELPKVERSHELSAEEWMGYFNEEGRITDEAGLRKRIFRGGIDPTIRVEVWKYLLNMYPFDSTYQERQAINENKRAEYFKWKSTWQFLLNDPNSRWNKLKSRCHNIDKDVVRTDRTLEFYCAEGNDNLKMLNEILITYTFYNFDLGYVQGMNELLSPILFVMKDESDAYWCFKGVMDVMEGNFHKDQNGMRVQLDQLTKMIKLLDQGLHDYLAEHDALNMFFCFRWILIIFKREFSFGTIQRLWEVLWSNHLTPNFHLFVATAILLKHRQEIINQEMQFDDIVKYVNELAGKLHLEEVLIEAEQIYNTFLRIASPELKKELEHRAPKHD